MFFWGKIYLLRFRRSITQAAGKNISYKLHKMDTKHELNAHNQCKINSIEYFSLYKGILIFTEKDRSIIFTLKTISNIRVIKTRCLKLNYALVLVILILFFMLNSFFLLDFVSKIVLNLVVLIGIVASFYPKKYSHELLINNYNLTYRKFEIVNDKVNNAQSFISTVKNNLNNLEGKLIENE